MTLTNDASLCTACSVRELFIIPTYARRERGERKNGERAACAWGLQASFLGQFPEIFTILRQSSENVGLHIQKICTFAPWKMITCSREKHKNNRALNYVWFVSLCISLDGVNCTIAISGELASRKCSRGFGEECRIYMSNKRGTTTRTCDLAERWSHAPIRQWGWKDTLFKPK